MYVNTYAVFCASDDDRTGREGIVHSNGQRTAIPHPKGEIESESDCENDSVGDGETASAVGQDRDEGVLVRVTLTPGSFTA